MIKIQNKYKINKTFITLLIYTICFFITALFVYYGFWKMNKALIWSTDGAKQHFPAMYEVRENLLTILKSGFKEIPFWNWDVGLGLNLSFIYTYDIFYWISVFIPEKYLVISYSGFIILKLYMAGFFLILYLKEIKIEGYSAVVGALVYSFCGYALFAGIRHPFFISPMFIFPLMILGVEKYITKNKNKLLIVSVFIATLSHYYFLYMMGIGMVIYSLIRCYSLKMKNIFKKMVDIGIRSMIGIGLGAFAILPNIILFLKSNRGTSTAKIDLIYNKSYYGAFIRSFIGPETGQKWTVLMFSGIVIIIIPLIFTKIFKGFEHIKIIFCLMTVMLFIPYVGSAMNGFSNVSNRWVFMYSFFISCITAIGVSRIKLLKKEYFITVELIIVIYIMIALITKDKFVQYIVSALFSTIMLLLIILRKTFNNIKFDNVFKIILIFMVIANISYISNYYYMPGGINYIHSFVTNDHVIEKYSQNNDYFKEISLDRDFFRVDQTNYAYGSQYSTSSVSNDGFVSNINSSGQYVSMMDKNIYKFFEENGVFNIKMIDSIVGYDNRSALESLLCVKYKIVRDDNEVYLGKGYKEKNTSGKYKLYENENVLSVGTFYSDYISNKDYMNLFEIDRAMALLQGVVLENDEDLDELNNIEPKVYSDNIEYQIDSDDNIQIKDNKIIVNKENAEVKIKTNISADSEIYLNIEGLNKEEKSSKIIYVSRNGKEKSILLNSSDDIYDPKQENKFVSLGYTAEELENEEIKLRFKEKGTYTFDKINIQTIDMKNYTNYIDKLKKHQLSDIEYGSNFISGNIEAPTDGVMLFAIPYDKGWTVEVDGKKVETMKLNTSFLGVKLDSGNHSIKVSFYPEGLNIGLCITGISILIIFLSYIKKLKNRNLIK